MGDSNYWWLSFPVSMFLAWSWRFGLLPSRVLAFMLVRGWLSRPVLLRTILIDTKNNSAHQLDCMRAEVECFFDEIVRALPPNKIPSYLRSLLISLLWDFLGVLSAEGARRVLLNVSRRHQDNLLDLVSIDNMPCPLVFMDVFLQVAKDVYQSDDIRFKLLIRVVMKKTQQSFQLDTEETNVVRNSLFINAALLFVDKVAPNLKDCLSTLFEAEDQAVIDFLNFCQFQLKRTQEIMDERFVGGRFWSSARDEFMLWSSSYLARARLRTMDGRRVYSEEAVELRHF